MNVRNSSDRTDNAEPENSARQIWHNMININSDSCKTVASSAVIQQREKNVYLIISTLPTESNRL